MPKLLEYFDKDSKRARRMPDTCAPKIKIEDKEEDKERENARDPEGVSPLPELSLLWNSSCGALGKIEKLNAAGLKLAADRYPDRSPEQWAALFRRVAASGFLSGKRGFKATFTWTIDPTNAAKIETGQYDDADQDHDAKVYNWARVFE